MWQWGFRQWDFRRAGRRTNLALLVLLVVSLVTGVLAFGIGTPAPATVVVAHGAAGLGLLLLVPWKSVVVRRGWRGNVGRRAPGVVLGVLVAVLVGSGLVHALAGFDSYVGLTPMQVHVGAAVIAAVALVAHLRVHGAFSWSPVARRADLSRRTALRAVGLGAGAGLVYTTVEGVAAVAALPGASRRGTGSHQVGSGDPAAMPVTQWFTDPVLQLDPSRWRLQVAGRRLALDELRAGSDVLRATLDCTNGWYAEQEWRGVRLDRLLGGARGRSIDVVSATGYSRRLPLRDAPHLVLATHVAGRPLSAGHGAPLRLVAPGRRGFWWVKWVARIEIVDAPWWVAPPFPLQ